jgi:hypothetical protein
MMTSSNSCSRNARPVGKRGVSAPRGRAGKDSDRPSLDARNRVCRGHLQAES